MHYKTFTIALLHIQLSAQTLTKKEGTQMLSVLTELHSWLSDADAKKAKDKQKMMRNLRVRQILHGS